MDAGGEEEETGLKKGQSGRKEENQGHTMSWTPKEGTFRSRSWPSVSVPGVNCCFSLWMVRSEEKPESVPLNFNIVVRFEARLQNQSGEGHGGSTCGLRLQTACARASHMYSDRPTYIVSSLAFNDLKK